MKWPRSWKKSFGSTERRLRISLDDNVTKFLEKPHFGKVRTWKGRTSDPGRILLNRVNDAHRAAKIQRLDLSRRHILGKLEDGRKLSQRQPVNMRHGDVTTTAVEKAVAILQSDDVTTKAVETTVAILQSDEVTTTSGSKAAEMSNCRNVQRQQSSFGVRRGRQSV